MFTSTCSDIIQEISSERKNGLKSIIDVLHIDSNILVNRLIVTTYNEIMKIPPLTQNFIFSDHNLHLSPFDMIKEFKNISVYYLFAEHILGIIEGRLKYGLYYDIKLSNKKLTKSLDIFTPFVIYNDNKIELVKLKKFINFHDVIKLPAIDTDAVEIKSHGFLLSDNVHFDSVLSKNLSLQFEIDEDIIIKEYENFKPLMKTNTNNSVKLFNISGAEDKLVFVIHHFFDIDLDLVLNIYHSILDKVLEFVYDKISNFDHTLYYYDGSLIREKFYGNTKDKNYYELYIKDILMSQIFSCILLSNDLNDGMNYFVVDKSKEIGIDNLIGLIEQYKKVIKTSLSKYFNSVKSWYS